MAKPAAAGGTGAAPEKKGKKKTFKKKERKHVPHGLAYVQASFNNTIVTISDMNGNVLSWKSSGSLGFRGSRKGTPFAAQQAASNAAGMARDHGLRAGGVGGVGPGGGNPRAGWRGDWGSPPPGLGRRCRTTAAVRRSGAESKKQLLASSLQ